MRDVCTGARDITLSVETVWFQLKEPEWKGRLQQLRDEATSPLPGWARRKTSLLVAPHTFFSTTVAGVRARPCRGILVGREIKKFIITQPPKGEKDDYDD